MKGPIGRGEGPPINRNDQDVDDRADSSRAGRDLIGLSQTSRIPATAANDRSESA